MDQDQKQKTPATTEPGKKIFFKPSHVHIPDASKFREPATEGSEEERKSRIEKHKKKLEQENKKRQKKRRLVCFSCWTKDGGCWCNQHEVDADHPLVMDDGRHHWKSWNGDGKCNTIPNAICITRELDGKKPE